MRKLNWLSLILATACTGLAGAQETSVKLPDIGSSAASAMSGIPCDCSAIRLGK